MNCARIVRHLLTGKLALHRIFPAASLSTIEQAIQQSEINHGGQICFAVEAALDTIPLFKNQTARERAIEVFSQLRIWDTEHNNGVLIYLLLADHDVEIIADRGIHTKVSSEEWEAICHTMEIAFQRQQFEAGVINGINVVGGHLREYFTSGPNHKVNELTNKPVVLE